MEHRWRRGRVTCPALLLAAATAAALLPRPSRADIALLDEYWSPEIVVNDVTATEVDTKSTGDATQAKTGEFSAKLENLVGFPNVRFRSAAMVRLDQIPLADQESEAALWYRTDAWPGPWRLEVWVYCPEADPGPVKVLEAALDGGGKDGTLLADDQWHQARGVLARSGAYDRVPQDKLMPTYVWLAPLDGWDKPHVTYVDRIEIEVVKGPLKGHPAPAPVQHVRGKPGAQTKGNGWVWWEGEDAVEHNVPHWGALLPNNAEEQGKLSNGDWLQWHGQDGLYANYEIGVPEAGNFALWCRGVGPPFEWQWQGQAWQLAPPEPAWTDGVHLRGHIEGPLFASWVHLGDLDLPAGKQTFSVAGSSPQEALGFDCFLLTKRPFTPHGAAKPGAP